MNALTNGFTIIVEKNNKSYHSLRDWGLAVGNNNYIGDPELQTTYIAVPGRDGYIDASEVVSGRPIYTKREISIEVGGLHERNDWDAIISGIRNKIQGRVCRIIFDNDAEYYWRGRVNISEFDRNRRLGTFKISLPDAEPYKYSVYSSDEPWLWDPFNFITGVITYLPSQQITGSGSITIPAGYMLTCPTIIVANITSGTFTVTVNGRTYTLSQGSNVFPSIMVGGDSDVTLNFVGTAKVQISYRSGSL